MTLSIVAIQDANFYGQGIYGYEDYYYGEATEEVFFKGFKNNPRWIVIAY